MAAGEAGVMWHSETRNKLCLTFYLAGPFCLLPSPALAIGGIEKEINQ